MDINFLVLCPIGLSVTIPSITASSTLAENRELGEPLRMYVPTDERDLTPLFCPCPAAVRFPWPDQEYIFQNVATFKKIVSLIIAQIYVFRY